MCVFVLILMLCDVPQVIQVRHTPTQEVLAMKVRLFTCIITICIDTFNVDS